MWPDLSSWKYTVAPKSWNDKSDKYRVRSTRQFDKEDDNLGISVAAYLVSQNSYGYFTNFVSESNLGTRTGPFTRGLAIKIRNDKVIADRYVVP